jgi:hypothetical protein
MNAIGLSKSSTPPVVGWVTIFAAMLGRESGQR